MTHRSSRRDRNNDSIGFLTELLLRESKLLEVLHLGVLFELQALELIEVEFGG